jgi:ESCRT-I complex subunit TSG101
MVVKPGHSVVDASGLARQLPYLQRWTFPSHNLVDCTRALADAFSRDPPLFAKPTASQQQQQLQQQQQQQQRPAGPDPRWTEMLREQEAVVAAATASAASAASGGYGAAQSGAGTVRYNQHYSTPPMPMAGGGAVQPQPSAYAAPLPMYAPQQGIAAQPPPPQRSAPPPPPPPLPPVESPEAAFRSRALASLRASARAALSAAAADSAERVTALLEEQSRLEVRRSALQAQLSPLRLEREALESHVSSLDASTVAVEAWLAENVARVPEDLSADAALAPRDAWQAQALAAAAEDAACEECLYSLAAALEAGKVGLDAYLRLVRQLCREQFMARATVLVVKAAQEATQGRG